MTTRPAGLTRWAALFLMISLQAVLPAISQAQGPGREEVLDEMRLRRIVGAEAQTWDEEEWDLLGRIKKAEGEGAVDYVIKRVPRYRTLVVTVKKEDRGIRLLLNAAGYERYQLMKSQDAIRAFESRGITVKEVFHLTDLTGRPFFDPQGRLTDEGEAAYDAMVRGEAPRWKFDWDPVPEEALSQEKKKDPPEVKALKDTGLVEIEQSEEIWLIRTSRCSERQMQEEASLRIVHDKFRNMPRYFIGPKDPLFALVQRYRTGDRDFQLGGTRFFGKGGGGLCD